MRQSGFTLLELSIVLVIIGLIIGGVTVGSELIRQAELQALSKDVYRYETAVQTFKLKYSYLPGDLPNASAYWSVSGTSNNAVCSNSSGLNGNGNGQINGRNWINNAEHSRLWQHLGLAQMISGTYRGTWGADGAIWGVTNPESPIKGVGYNLQFTTNCDGTTFTVNGRSGHFFEISSRGETNGKTGDAAVMWAGGSLAPAEAASIDQKLDDGRYDSGKWTAQDQVTGCVGSGGAYNVANTGRICGFFYWPMF